MSFSVISQNFLLGWGPKFPLFDSLAQKAHTPQTLQNMGFQQTSFWKTDNRHETAIFGPPKKNPEIQVIIFWALFLLIEQQKHKKMLKPLFYSGFSKHKKRIFNIDL